MLSMSQNYGLVEVRRHLWSSSNPAPLPRQCQLGKVAKDCVQLNFDTSQAWWATLPFLVYMCPALPASPSTTNAPSLPSPL